MAHRGGPSDGDDGGPAPKAAFGEGRAVPVGFAAEAISGVLIVATDGLWRFASRVRIAEAVLARPLEVAAGALIDGARLRSGALQDDVALAICDLSVDGA